MSDTQSVTEPGLEEACEAPVAAARGRRATRRAGFIAGLALLLVLLHLVGLLAPLETAISRWLPDRPSEALLKTVNVFTCCVFTWRALTTMLPAFLLAGAIGAFIPATVILRYLGAGARRWTAYLAAAICGPLLSLCSCNIVPLFASIYRRGAGIGPAFTFLYAGPAINAVAIIFTYQVIGWRIGLWRMVCVPLVALATGLAMSLLYRKEEAARHAEHTARAAAAVSAAPEDNRRLGPLFAFLLGMVIFGSLETTWLVKGVGMGVLALGTAVILARWFSREEWRAWGQETWGLVKLVIPVLLPAILIIGAIAAYMDIKIVYRLVGPVPDSAGFLGAVRPIALADVFGALMYFPVLSEVPFTKAFLKLHMNIGPALGLLLTGPGLSLPGLFLIARSIGWKKAVTYEAIVITLTTTAAYLFSTHIGRYICECMMNGK